MKMDQERLMELIQAYLSEQATDEEVESLSQQLKEDESAREMFIEASDLHANLAVDESLWSESTAVPFPEAQPAKTNWKSILPWAIAAMVTFAFLLDKFPTSDNTTQDSSPDTFVGLLVDEAGAEFEEGFGPADVRFDAREYRLQSGTIHLRLENGADLVMRSPATFQIQDSFHLNLLDGSLRAVVPPSAEGLTIAAPEVNYEDLGTELGVTVNRESGTSRIHVFDGQVDAKEAGSNRLLSSVTSGQTMRYANSQFQQSKAPQPGEFPVPGEIGLARWQNWRKGFIKDANLVAFYSFERETESTTLLTNEVGNASNGKIHGARWVTGRWPGKKALLFDRDEDFVGLDIPGEYEELTLSFWVKVDRLDYEYNALLNSKGWGTGDLHFQIKRTGQTWANVNGKKSSFPRFIGKPLQQNRWQHIVGIVSRPENVISTYLNGELEWEQDLKLKNLISPLACSIGNWRDIPEKWQPTNRAFKGRIDEVAIWNRALAEKEIKAHYEAGRPSLLDD